MQSHYVPWLTTCIYKVGAYPWVVYPRWLEHGPCDIIKRLGGFRSCRLELCQLLACPSHDMNGLGTKKRLQGRDRTSGLDAYHAYLRLNLLSQNLIGFSVMCGCRSFTFVCTQIIGSTPSEDLWTPSFFNPPPWVLLFYSIICWAQ